MGSFSIKPLSITSVTVGDGPVTTGASLIISVAVVDGGFYAWEDWDSSTWGEVSNLTWGA